MVEWMRIPRILEWTSCVTYGVEINLGVSWTYINSLNLKYIYTTYFKNTLKGVEISSFIGERIQRIFCSIYDSFKIPKFPSSLVPDCLLPLNTKVLMLKPISELIKFSTAMDIPYMLRMSTFPWDMYTCTSYVPFSSHRQFRVITFEKSRYFVIKKYASILGQWFSLTFALLFSLNSLKLT